MPPGTNNPVGPVPWDGQNVIRGRESTENIPASRLTRDVSDRISEIDPDAAPFTLLTRKMRTRRTHNPRFEWFEKDLPAQWDQTGGAVLAATTTGIPVRNARYFSVGDVIEHSASGEQARVTAVDVAADTIDAIRGVGSTVASAWAVDDDIAIIGTAYAEGSPLGLEKTHIETNPYNFTQIFRTPLGLTGTMEQTETYVGPEKPRLRAEAAIAHKLLLEKTALFGERGIDITSTANPRRYTGGLFYFFNQNIKDAGGALTVAELENWFEVLFHHAGSGQKLLFASPLVCSVFDMLAIGNIQIVPKETTYGVSIRNWVTTHGSLSIVKHRLLEFGPSGTQGYGGTAVAVDPSKVAYRPLGNRDTKLRVDVGAPGDDATTDEYLTEVGFQFENVGLGGILEGVTSAGA